MIVKIGVSFNVREARELVAEINDVMTYITQNAPALEKLRNRLENPLAPTEEVKIPAQVQEQ